VKILVGYLSERRKQNFLKCLFEGEDEGSRHFLKEFYEKRDVSSSF